MPKLWIFSDLHLETVPYPQEFRPVQPDYDVLVAAGDIWEGDCASAFRFLRTLAPEKPIVFVMGNHEHWNGVVSEELQLAKLLAKEYGVVLLDGTAEAVAGCRFVGATLWSDYSLGGSIDPKAETGEQIDIEHDGGTHLITVGDTIALHLEARTRLETLIENHDGSLPLVVVTHHAPHPACLPPGLQNTWRAKNNASDLSHLTDSGKVALWIHGHTHHCIDIVRPNGTRIVSNAAGPRFVDPAFQDVLIVGVDG